MLFNRGERKKYTYDNKGSSVTNTFLEKNKKQKEETVTGPCLSQRETKTPALVLHLYCGARIKALLSWHSGFIIIFS